MSKAEDYDALASRLAEANERIAAAEKRIAELEHVEGDTQTVADILRDFDGPEVYQQAQQAVAALAEAERFIRAISAWDQCSPNPMTGDHAFFKREADAWLAAREAGREGGK